MMDTLVRPTDVIAIYIEDDLAFYGRVDEILPDVKRGWRQLRFLALISPPQDTTWILEPEQIDGKEFTMGGKRVRIDRLPTAVPTPPKVEPSAEEAPSGPAKIISFPGKGKK